MYIAREDPSPLFWGPALGHPGQRVARWTGCSPYQPANTRRNQTVMIPPVPGATTSAVLERRPATPPQDDPGLKSHWSPDTSPESTIKRARRVFSLARLRPRKLSTAQPSTRDLDDEHGREAIHSR